MVDPQLVDPRIVDPRIGTTPPLPPEVPGSVTVVGGTAPEPVRSDRAGTDPGAGGDIPSVAVAAYQRAAAVLAEAAPTCRLSWSLLAAIGRVESDHGRHGGATLRPDGVSEPFIIGPRLDGVGPVSAIRDSDGGALDADATWDHAVGPMQFIPGTWAITGADGDGDGVRSPHDLDDAALAAGVYLCAGGSALDEPAGMRLALLRYNHSSSYASLVMSFERAYRMRRQPAAAAAWPTIRPVAHAVAAAGHAGAASAADGRPPKGNRAKRPPAGAADAASRPAPTPLEVTDPPTKPHPAPSPKPTPRPPSPDPGPADEPEPSMEPGRPTPSSGPDTPTAPAPSTPTESPVSLQEQAGLWEACDAGYCLADRLLLLERAGAGEALATEDHDGDGTLEVNDEEFRGLVGQTVTVLVRDVADGWEVAAVNGVGISREELPTPDGGHTSVPPEPAIEPD